MPHHDFFCKRSLPLSISDTHYLHNVVGDTEIRKGEGMQLDQLIQNTSRDTNARIQPFDLDLLREAFQLRETSPIDLPPVRNLIPWVQFCFCWLICFYTVWHNLIHVVCAGFILIYHALAFSSIRFYFIIYYSLSPSGRKGGSYHCWKIKKWVQRQGEEA